MLKEKTIKMKIPVTKYQRYSLNYENNPRKLLIDFRCIRSYSTKINYGDRRRYKWQSPQQLRALVNNYFDSCIGYLYDWKSNLPLLDPNGEPRKGIIKPYTISGLALALHISTMTLKDMSSGAIADLGIPTDEDYVGETYADIIDEARQRIETYAEENIYSRDGYNGGHFVLDAAFKWTGSKEKAEIKSMKAKTKLAKKEFDLKKEVIDGADSDEPVTITIKRAEKRAGE